MTYGNHKLFELSVASFKLFVVVLAEKPLKLSLVTQNHGGTAQGLEFEYLFIFTSRHTNTHTTQQTFSHFVFDTAQDDLNF